MNILSIDTSTSSLSICVRRDDTILGEITLNNGLVHSTSLMPALQALFNVIGFDKTTLDLVAVCVGPGSFTGIRIGVATANAFSMALSIPSISIDSLYALAMNFDYFNGTIISTIDAQRDNYYVGIYECDAKKITKIQENTIMSDEQLDEYIKKLDKNLLLCGDAIDVIENENITLAKNKDNFIKASNIAMMVDAVEKNPQKYATPSYMRKSQAEITYEEKHKDK